MNELDNDLATYYEQEATIRAARPIDPQRVQRRDEFIATLVAQGRRSLVEFGTGPGRDAAAFIGAGIAVAGVDLAAEHVRLARAVGVDAHQGSLFDPVFGDRRFDCGWTMSTLVHVPDRRFDDAMSRICAVLVAGAPLAVGLWGGFDAELISDLDEIVPPRLFCLRTHQRAREMLGRYGDVERFDTWSHGTASGWEYQFAVLRMRGEGRG